MRGMDDDGCRGAFAGDACRSRVYKGEPSRIIMGNGGVGPYNLVYVQLSLGFGGHLFLFFFAKAFSVCDMNLL